MLRRAAPPADRLQYALGTMLAVEDFTAEQVYHFQRFALRVRLEPAPQAVVMSLSVPAEVTVMELPEAGEIEFGDGMSGARPPSGPRIRATYSRATGADVPIEIAVPSGRVALVRICTSGPEPCAWLLLRLPSS